MAQVFHADTATLSAMIQAQDARGFGFRNALYRRALSGDVRVMEVLPGVTGRLLKPYLRRPGGAVAVIGDDGGISAGPVSFSQARRLFGWASHVMLHAAGGELEHYQIVADTAAAGAHVLLIETCTSHEAAWVHEAGEERERRARKGMRPFAMLLIQVPANAPPHPAVVQERAA
jgi:hypothetical protein